MANGTQIADQSDCTIFYQCIQGSPVAFTCPTGMMYNKDSSSCTLPSLSTCPSYNTYCQNINSVAFLPDPISCTGYYYCDGTNALGQHGNCPSGENFNPSAAACVYAANYLCSGQNPDSPDTSTPEENEMCTVIPSNTYFGVSTNCSQWAACSNGIYTTGTCPFGFEFNTANGDCDYNSNVVCQQLGVDNNGNQVTELPPAIGGACTTVGTYTSDGMTCNGFYWCSYSLVNAWGVCANNMFFDAATSSCVDRSTILCTVGNICANTENTEYTWVDDPTNCQKYYYCQNNQPSSQSYYCPNGEYFDQVHQMCADTQPTYAACAGAPVPPTNSPITPAGPDATGSSGSPGSPGTGSTPTGSTGTGSTATGSTATGSTATGSTATGSTATGSTGTDSTVTTDNPVTA